MSITVDIPAGEIAALKEITKLDNDAEAILKAVREFLRLSRLRGLKTAFGKVEFEDNRLELEKLELDETPFPQ